MGMPGLIKAMERKVIAFDDEGEHMGPQSNGSGSSWRTAAISGLGAVVLLLSGWSYADSRAAQQQSSATISALADAQRIDRERIAILEEANRNVRESLQRIESVVNEIRDRRRQ
jgi:hypothetical protein